MKKNLSYDDLESEDYNEMYRLHPFEQPDAVKPWHHLRVILAGPVAIVLTVCLLAFVPDINAWYDSLPKTERTETSIVLFCLGLLSLSALFFSGVLKRN